jgi:elongation factor P--(R)-beta-lysine ligase
MLPDNSLHLQRIKANLERRSLILDGIRAFFRNNGFLEVETPLRVPVVAPEQFIAPFSSEGWWLSTSPELQMKRLLAAGYTRIFQICHCFRRNESGRLHNPEFTMIEWYRAASDYRQMIMDTENLVLSLASRLNNASFLEYQGQKIDLRAHWPQITVREAFLKWAGWDPVETFDGERFDVDTVDRLLPNFSQDRPTVIRDYPREAASLARLKTDDRKVAERAEVFIGGLEIANAYSELNDPIEQRDRFQSEIEKIKQSGGQASLPEKFLAAVSNLPECSGIALGIDRLVMLLCDAGSIDEVMAFPASEL